MFFVPSTCFSASINPTSPSMTRSVSLLTCKSPLPAAMTTLSRMEAAAKNVSPLSSYLRVAAAKI